MKRLSLGLIAALSVFFSASAAATPVTIGFDSLTMAGSGFTNIQFNTSPTISTYTESGFVLTATGNTPGASGFGSAHTGESTYYFGSTSLFNDDTNGGVTVLTKADGSIFSLLSMKVSALNHIWSFIPGQEFVTFIGTRADGSTVTQRVELTDNLSFKTVTFSGFDEVVSVSWAQGSPATRGYNQFDDIVVDGSPAAPATDVPEPGSIALLGVGLLGLTLRRRGKAGAAQA